MTAGLEIVGDSTFGDERAKIIDVKAAEEECLDQKF